VHFSFNAAIYPTVKKRTPQNFNNIIHFTIIVKENAIKRVSKYGECSANPGCVVNRTARGGGQNEAACKKKNNSVM
jgi:hypothetical protein